MISLITAYYKNEEMTVQFLDNLVGKIPKDTEVILVNAASKPIYHTLVTKRVDLRENQSFSNSMNEGIKVSTGDYICIIGNDGFPRTHNWLTELVDGIHKTGASIICPDNTNPSLRVLARHIYHEGNRYVHVDMFPAICWVLKRETIDRVGLFDERFIIGTYEDDDYCKRVRDNGGKIVVDKEVVIEHLLSKTFGMFPVNEIMHNNFKLFREKWGING